MPASGGIGGIDTGISGADVFFIVLIFLFFVFFFFGLFFFHSALSLF